MKKVCLFLFLLFDCSNTMDYSTMSYNTCSAIPSIGENISMLLMYLKTLESRLTNIFNHGGIFGWIYPIGRAV